MEQLLFQALGVSVSPLPIAAVVVMLLTGDRMSTSTGFLAGWLTGIALVLDGAGSLGQAVENGRSGGTPLLPALVLTIGVLAVAVAVRTWRRRPGRGAPPGLPAWIATVGALHPARAALVGLLLVGANPKVLALVVPAGIALAAEELSAAENVLAGGAFVLLAGSTVLVPVALRQAVGRRADPALVTMRGALVRHGAVISAVVLLVVGVVLTVQGAAGLVAAVVPPG